MIPCSLIAKNIIVGLFVDACVIFAGCETDLIFMPASDVASARGPDCRVFEGSESLAHRCMLSDILNANPIACFVIDNDHRITHWNRGAEKMIGLSAAEMIGTRLQRTCFYVEERDTLADCIIDGAMDRITGGYVEKNLRTSDVVDEAFEAEGFFPRLGGGRWLSFTAAPLRNTQGQVIGAIETLHDITAQRDAEVELKMTNERLETLVSLRTRQLQEKNLELESALAKLSEQGLAKGALA